MALKTCHGICKRFMHQIKRRHSWRNEFDYRVYNFRVVRMIGGRSRLSDEYLRCNKCECFMVREMAFVVKGVIRCPCCNNQLSYGKRAGTRKKDWKNYIKGP